MEYDDFLECFEDVATCKDGEFTGCYPRVDEYFARSRGLQDGYWLVFSAHVGGYTGGNCWDDTEPYYESTKNRIDYSILDKGLILLAPNLTFMQYKGIEQLIKGPYEYVRSEYYGNTTEYEFAFLNLRELFNLLKEFGHVHE